MKHTQFPPISDVSIASFSSRRSNLGGGFFAGVMAALHESRRLQAARSIRQYRHLIHQEPEAGAAKRTAPSPREQVSQIVCETEKPTAKPGAMMSFHSKLIIAIVVVGF